MYWTCLVTWPRLCVVKELDRMNTFTSPLQLGSLSRSTPLDVCIMHTLWPFTWAISTFCVVPFCSWPSANFSHILLQKTKYFTHSLFSLHKYVYQSNSILKWNKISKSCAGKICLSNRFILVIFDIMVLMFIYTKFDHIFNHGL